VGAIVFYQDTAGDDVATLQMTFKVSGTPTDPSTISCVITDPDGLAVTHTFGGAAPADITRISTGLYQLLVPSTKVGLWGFVWIGTGAASDIQAGTWTVNPTSTINQFYTSVEELKDRLQITDTASDMQLALAVQAAARAIEGFTGRFFWKVAETRTYQPYSIYELPIDDLVSITALNVDYDGDGIYETPWVQHTDYELQIGHDEFNANVTGEARPFTLVRSVNASGGGRFFPFIWPYSKWDRIQIIGTWGWPAVPFGIKQAAVQVASEFFKLKDSPFGLVGTSEFGVVRVPKVNPYIQKLLTPYISPRRKVGV
jgi:hypothetical protein